MGTILVKSALNGLKIEVLEKKISLKKFNLVAHFLLLTIFLQTSLFKAFKALFTKIVPIFCQLSLEFC